MLGAQNPKSVHWKMQIISRVAVIRRFLISKPTMETLSQRLVLLMKAMMRSNRLRNLSSFDVRSMFDISIEHDLSNVFLWENFIVRLCAPLSPPFIHYKIKEKPFGEILRERYRTCDRNAINKKTASKL